MEVTDFNTARLVPNYCEAWALIPMKQLGNTYGGLTGKTKKHFGRGQARYIPFMNVMTETVIDTNWLEQVDVARDEAQNEAKKGDLFFNGSSETPEEVGFCSVLLDDIPNLYLNSFCFGFRFNSDAKVNGIFFAYWFRSREGRKAMSALAQGATRYNIAKSAFLQLEIPQPKADEQTLIAAVLSDLDAMLDKLDQLIAKKRDLKQAAMQQLLTGQTRLPGFSGAWEVRKLGNILAEIGDGATPSTAKSQYFGGSIAWVVIDDIKDEIWFTRNTLTEAGLHACAAKLWPVGTLILSTGATIGEVGIAKVPLATKQGICGLVFDSGKAVPVFMKYWFTLNKPMILTKAQGSSIKEVRAPILSQLEVCLPSISEQSVIANALSDMDAELAALEARRDKARELKQGMMQELLTGRIRLV